MMPPGMRPPPFPGMPPPMPGMPPHPGAHLHASVCSENHLICTPHYSLSAPRLPYARTCMHPSALILCISSA
eukprot:1108370-Pelagomonas_calceolata.AAC.1